MWNWLMARPDRMLLTVGAVFIFGAAALLYEMNRPPFVGFAVTAEESAAYRSVGWEPYTAEVHEAWQANCESLQQPGRLCGN